MNYLGRKNKMIRADIISVVGREYLTSNIENDEYSYPKAYSTAALTFTPISSAAPLSSETASMA